MPGLLDIILPNLAQKRVGLEADRLALAEKRRQLAEDAGKRRQYQRLPGLLNPQTPLKTAGMTDEQRQQGLLDVAARTQPAETLQGLLGPGQQDRAEPSFIRMLRTLDDPTLPQDQKDLLRQKIQSEVNGQNDPSLDNLVKETQIKLNMMTLEDRAKATAEKADTAAKQFRVKQNGMAEIADQIVEAAQLNRKLSTQFLSSGSVLPDMKRAIASLGVDFLSYAPVLAKQLGVDNSEAQQMLVDYDRFNKLTTKRIVDSIGDVAGSGLGTGNVMKLTMLAKSMAGVGVMSGANDLIFSDDMADLLRMADIEGVTLPNADKLRELIPKLREVKRVSLGRGVTVERQ